ncbi:lysozyme [Paraburkholderia atlantica]|uniref:lysozyme n=1 Tax=Paraburkholderia atlantica TaxID=2654982 RepID=UPI00159207FA|nr:lysozyme [Paraburkholderia atlantica]
MEWLDKAIELAKEFEGCSLTAYPDPAYGWRVPSIGFGATGPAISQHTVWTQAQADADLEYRMKGIGAHIDLLVTVPISDEQKAACADLAYNIGLGAFERSTLLRMLNGHNVQGAADQFLVWTKANGVELKGLVKRRDAERALFILGSDFSKDDAAGEAQIEQEASQ